MRQSCQPKSGNILLCPLAHFCFAVDILNGAAVKRTLTSSITSAIYTAAQQTADWGAPLGPGQTLAIRILQLSNRLGRGDPAAVILQF
jgi:phage tail protein X